MSLDFSYRHLYYFWVVAKEGGIARAANRLGMAVQTVSAQVRELERALGHTLLKPAGRSLVLTDAGTAALRQAEQIFQLGEQLPHLLRGTVAAPSVRLTVGISEGLPKLAVRQLMQPVMQTPNLRLLCLSRAVARPLTRTKVREVVHAPFPIEAALLNLIGRGDPSGIAPRPATRRLKSK